MTDRRSLTYVELDVPTCTLAYGLGACRANRGVGFPVGGTNAMRLDGTTEWWSRGAELTGLADGKSGILSISHRTLHNDGVEFMLFADDNTRFTLRRNTSNKIALWGTTSGGTTCVLMVSNRTVKATDGMVHILAAWDCANSRGWLYIDGEDALDTTADAYSNNTIDYAGSGDYAIGALVSGLSKSKGDFGQVWARFDTYLDLSDADNRAKFVTPEGLPVPLGGNGELPTGTAPIIFLDGPAVSWHTNKGTGGDFNINGTPEAVPFATGEHKCFNSLGSCQDLTSFDEQTTTLRFAKSTAYLPKDIEAIPALVSADLTPATISLAENLGERAVLNVKLQDMRWPDTGEGYDPYHAERDYDPYRHGTYFGRFRARHSYLRGRDVRLIRGFVGDAIEDMDTRHYLVESIDGPSPDGSFRIIGQDVLKLFDDERALAPVPSGGVLLAGIDASVTSASLSPAGVGDDEYPSSGYLNLGGSEIVSFTRSADALTITRGALNTTAVAHDLGERAQLVLAIAAEDPADIIKTLAEDYAGVDTSFIPIDAWLAETAAYLGPVYTRYVAEPTGVRQLIAELVQEAALILWWDDSERKIRLQVLRAIATDAAQFDADNMLHGSFSVREQPEKRVSTCRVYHGLRNPLLQPDDAANYSFAQQYSDVESESLYGSMAFKAIYSRWITASGVTAALRVAALHVARFKDPPRRFTWDVLRTETVQLGQGYQIGAWPLQDATGAEILVPVQTTRLGMTDDLKKIEAEEVRFTGFDIPEINNTDRVLILDQDELGVNLRTKHDTIYQEPTVEDVADGVNLTVYINAGVLIGATDVDLPALDIGNWPTGFPIEIINLGRVEGAGGRGGNGCYWNQTPEAGYDGGPAIKTRHPISIDNTDGEIWGGGGGGGGGAAWGGIFSKRWSGAGGGGAGWLPGAGAITGGSAESGEDGTADAGGAGGNDDADGSNFGGDGGGPGLDGDTGGAGGAVGGDAGASVDGDSEVTWIAAGDIRGPQIN